MEKNNDNRYRLNDDEIKTLAYLRDNNFDTEAVKDILLPLKSATQKLYRARKENTLLKRQLKDYALNSVPLEDSKHLDIDIGSIKPYKIKAKSKKSECVIALSVSDVHAEAVITKDMTDGLNEFNEAICKARLEDLFCQFVDSYKNIKETKRVTGLLVRFLGDMFQGLIHEEMKMSNSMSPSVAFDFLLNTLASCIDYTLDNTDNLPIVIPCSSGNHDRLTDKSFHDNVTGYCTANKLYSALKLYYKNNKRVTFIISPTYYTFYDVFDFSMAQCHGHFINVKQSRHKDIMSVLYTSLDKAFLDVNKYRRVDHISVAHFHTLTDGKRWGLNGSVVGTTPYALHVGFPPEKAQQLLHVIDKDNFIIETRKLYLQ